MPYVTRWTVGSSWLMVVLVTWLLFVPAVVSGSTWLWTSALAATMACGAWVLMSRMQDSQTVAQILHEAEARGSVRE